MKLIRSLSLIFLIAGFTFTLANAQSPKTTEEGTYLITDYYLPCFDEIVSGEVNFESMLVNSQFLEKIWGTLTGETTGNIYTVSQIVTENFHPPTGFAAINLTETVNLKFRLDGKLVFLLQLTFHGTVNANGELVVYHDFGSVKCK